MDKENLYINISNILTVSKNLRQFSNIINKNKDLVLKIREVTNFMPIKTKLIERIYYILHQNDCRSNCFSCGGSTKFINVNEGYKKYCSKCIRQSPEYIAKRESTMIVRYGVKNISNLETTKVNLSKKAIARYSDPTIKKEIIDKFEHTCQTKYGKNNPAQVDEFKIKSKNTNIHRIGVDHPLKTEQGMDKLRKTNLDRLGVEYATQSPITKEQRA